LQRIANELTALGRIREEKRERAVSTQRPDMVPIALEVERKSSTQQPFNLDMAALPPITRGRPDRPELSVDQARAQLIDVRERIIKTKFPDADPARGFFRKSMLDELLRKIPTICRPDSQMREHSREVDGAEIIDKLNRIIQLDASPPTPCDRQVHRSTRTDPFSEQRQIASG
jgi:hypothetical protein